MIAFQLGVRLTAIRQHYDSINESVMAPVSMSQLRRSVGEARPLPLPMLASGAIMHVTDLSCHTEGGAA